MQQEHWKKQAGMILAGWVLLLAIMFSLWELPVKTGELADTDDYMRMVRVFDLIDGQGGASYAAPRLGVDGQAEIGWSRLVDWPLTLIQGTLEDFTDRMSAAMLTATIMPSFGALLLLLAAIWYVRPLIKGRSLIFVLLASLFFWAMMRQFMPGRVDHHMWQILLGLCAYGAVVRIYFTPERSLYPGVAGAALATGLAIGADILPWFTFITAMLGLFWLVRGNAYKKAGLVYGLTTLGVTFVWHLSLHDSGRFLYPSCDSLSVVWLMLAAVMSIFWAIVYFMPSAGDWKKRLIVGGVVAVPLLAFLYVLFPDCFRDPYQIDNPLVREIWLSAVKEARSLPALYADNKVAGLFFVVPVLLALVGSVWALRVEKKDRLLWAGITVTLLCGMALGFYQVRTVDFTQAVALAPMAWLLVAGFDKGRAFVGRFQLTRQQRLSLASGFFMLSFVCFVFSVMTHEEQKAEEKIGKDKICVLYKAAETLNTMPGSQTVAAFIDNGSEILFRTNHKALAAPYHRNQDGILAAYSIVTAPDEDLALRHMEESKTDIILLCDDPGNIWTGEKRGHEAPFAQALFAGEMPDWLQPVGGTEENGGYLILKKVK